MSLPAAGSGGGGNEGGGAPTKKRSLLDAISSDEPTLWLQLASGERLPAHRELLKFASRCVKGLPEGDTWDLSGLTIGPENKPVSREAVVAWLETIYNETPTTYAEDFSDLENEEAAQQVRPFELLLFADAVGSSQRVLDACYRRVARHDDLTTIDVVLAGEPLKLQLDGRQYCIVDDRLCEETLTERKEVRVVVDADAGLKQLRAQVVPRLEELLWMAYRLNLGVLQDRLRPFLHTNSAFPDETILNHNIIEEAVLSNRVLSAISKQQLRRAIAAEICQYPYELPGNDGQGLVDMATPALRLRLEGKTRSAYMGTPAGTEVKLCVDLDSGHVLAGETPPRVVNTAKLVFT